VWIESRIGKMKATLRFSDAVEPDTVWTWNAIAKGPGSWGLDPSAPEATRAMLINHIIPDTIPLTPEDTWYNNDPITGQAGWYDTRVRVYPSEIHEIWPKVAPREPIHPTAPATSRLAYTTKTPPVGVAR
jgi:anaerobic selenocysteine-containing dehydrogenase